MDLQTQTVELIQRRFPDEFSGSGAHAGQVWAEVKRGRIVDILRALKDELKFEMLMDVTAVDWLDQGKPERFSLVYQLYSLTHQQAARVKAWVPEDVPEIDTLSGVWHSANWGEREVYDMYGILFRGHPDLKRILLPDSYKGWPLRKDYPLTGHGERYDFPKHLR